MATVLMYFGPNRICEIKSDAVYQMIMAVKPSYIHHYTSIPKPKPIDKDTNDSALIDVLNENKSWLQPKSKSGQDRARQKARPSFLKED